MEIKIQIKSIFGNVLFELSKENNTLKDTLREANLRGANLRGANLYEANLREADLREANLYEANLYGADLRGANLYEADLRGANLRGANLYEADLRGANLREANLYEADLRGANLREADLRGANLYEANLYGADLREVKHNEGTAFFAHQCPDGSFIGYKKVVDNKIVKLLILENAKRSSSTSLKCRCSKALVLDIQEINGQSANMKSISSNRDYNFIYTVGEIVEVPNFDEDRWNECSSGIHFFISRDVAVQY